ncbi:hypothetical protein RJ639_013160 [Escallonia herrerae]|uniref:Uncharacterized protein n=1 Tax=Escallonia herrerae TaxID=1293975 RepID=A0AA88VJN3_9ASTE|nr:hypothetical protein RJ639_013160 [Escallonia herrerae]
MSTPAWTHAPSLSSSAVANRSSYSLTTSPRQHPLGLKKPSLCSRQILNLPLLVLIADHDTPSFLAFRFSFTYAGRVEKGDPGFNWVRSETEWDPMSSGYRATVDDFMRLYLENVARSVGWYYIHNRVRVIKGGPKSNKGWHSRYFFIQHPSGKWEFPQRWNEFCKDFEKKGFLAPNTLTKKLIDHIKRRGGLSIDEPLSEQELRHGGLIPPAPARPLPPTPIVESRRCLAKVKVEKATSSGCYKEPLKERKKEREGSSPAVKRPRAHVLPPPSLLVKDLPADQDPIFYPRWTIKRGDSGMLSSHVSAQYLAHGVLPSDKAILENQPHDAFAMAYVPAAYNAYCYSSQMHERFGIAMDMARVAETEKREALSKVGGLEKEIKSLKAEKTELFAKVSRLEKRCKKLKKAEADSGDRAIQAFLDGAAGDEWLRKHMEDGLSIFEKAKELTLVKYPDLAMNDITMPDFGSHSGEIVVPSEARDAVSREGRGTHPGNAPALRIALPSFCNFT